MRQPTASIDVVQDVRTQNEVPRGGRPGIQNRNGKHLGAGAGLPQLGTQGGAGLDGDRALELIEEPGRDLAVASAGIDEDPPIRQALYQAIEPATGVYLLIGVREKDLNGLV